MAGAWDGLKVWKSRDLLCSLVKSEDPTIEILAQSTLSMPLVMLFNISKFGSIYPKKTSDVF
jgi:hypothetical protein